MEKTVIFRDRQQILAEDITNIQVYAQSSIDAVIAAAVVDRAVYHGFAAAKTAAAEVTVAAGRFFDIEGKIYARETPTVRSFIGQLPAVARKKVAIVTYGALDETAVAQRKFRINAGTGLTESDEVPMRLQRSAQLSFLIGQEAGDPQLPAIDAGYVHLATVTLSPTQVESVEMITGNAAANLAGVATAVASHQALLSVFEGLFVTLRSDMAALAERQKLLASAADVQALGFDLARLKARAGIAGNAVAFGDDLFLDEAFTDPAYGGYQARIFAGLRFPEAAGVSVPLQLFNNLDPAVKMTGGFCLPAYDVEPRLIIDGYAGDLALANYQSQNVEMRQLTRTRSRVVHGETSEIIVNLNDPSYDRAKKIYSRDGEAFNVAAEWWSGGSDRAMIVLQPTSAVVEELETYWDAVTTSTTVQGSTLAQSLFNAQAGYTVGVNAYFTDIAAAGDVHCHLVELDDSGAPDMTRGIATVTKAVADLKKYPAATNFGLPPTILEAGKRYAYVFISQGAHRMAVADKNRYAAGALFSSADGAWFTADANKDLLLEVLFCRFKASRVVVQLQPLQLAGGISDLDFLYESAHPAGTGLSFEYQPQGGGEWRSAAGPDLATGLSTLPALVNLRMVFVGSEDVMPGIKLTDSVARVFRLQTTMDHFTPVLVRATTSTIKVTAYARGFNASAPFNHTLVAKILIGGVTELHDLVADEIVPALGADPGGIKRTWTFNIAAPTSSYRIQLHGTVANGLAPFVITERVDQAL